MGRAGRRKKEKAQRNERDGFRKNKKERVPYPETVRENAAFENYYKEQSIVNAEEWQDFIKICREPLPAVFRVTGSKSQADQLLNLIKHDFFNELGDSAATDVTTHPAGSPDDEAKTDTVAPPVCLPWYPDNLAWQLEYSRMSIRNNTTLKKLHSFLVSESESGNISRQEAVSMIPPLLMHVKSHHKVLDMCAAPGSKTAQLIEYLHADTENPLPEGFVIANDMDNRRCYLMVHQVKRLQSPNLMVINHDASRLPNMTFQNKTSGKLEQLLFDRILCDVPCSGDGTLRKNPEIWRSWGTGHALNLHNVQLRVLQRGLELLAVGGRLVYSTCSFNPIENEAVIAAMLNTFPGCIDLIDCTQEMPQLKRQEGLKSWKVLTKNGLWFGSYAEVPKDKQSWVRPSMFPPENIDTLNLNRCMRIVPHHQNTGGFFIAVIEKTNRLPTQKAEVKTEVKAEVKTEVEDSQNLPSEIVVKTEPQTEVERNSPPHKKIKYAGFREEPFYYFTADDQTWPDVRKFYGVDERFDCTQLMVRNKEGGKKRNIYLSSLSIRNVALNNENQIKYINTGVKVFARSEHAMCECSYRLVQDGIASIYPYIQSRRLEVNKEDVVALLTQENPFFSRLSVVTQSLLQAIDVGGLLLIFPYKDENGPVTDILMTGWRGKASCRVYVPKFERHHILRLCGIDPDKVLIDAEWAIKGKGEKLDDVDQDSSNENDMANNDSLSNKEAEADLNEEILDDEGDGLKVLGENEISQDSTDPTELS